MASPLLATPTPIPLSDLIPCSPSPPAFVGVPTPPPTPSPTSNRLRHDRKRHTGHNLMSTPPPSPFRRLDRTRQSSLNPLTPPPSPAPANSACTNKDKSTTATPTPLLLPYDRTAHQLVRSYLHTKLPPELTHMILPVLHEETQALYKSIRFNFRVHERVVPKSACLEEEVREEVVGRKMAGGGTDKGGNICVFLPRLRNTEMRMRRGEVGGKRIWAVCVLVRVEEVKAAGSGDVAMSDASSVVEFVPEGAVQSEGADGHRRLSDAQDNVLVKEPKLENNNTLRHPPSHENLLEPMAATTLNDSSLHSTAPTNSTTNSTNFSTPPSSRRSSLASALVTVPPTPARSAFIGKGQSFSIRLEHGALPPLPVWSVQEGWVGPLTKVRWFRRGVNEDLDRWLDGMRWAGETKVVVEGAGTAVRRAEVGVYAC